MINRHCRKFLKYLRKTKPDFNGNVYTFDFLIKNYPESEESIYRMIWYLEKAEYVKASTINEIRIGIACTEKAIYEKQFAHEELKKFLFKSIFTPIVVSILTTLATLYIPKLLQCLLSYLQSH